MKNKTKNDYSSLSLLGTQTYALQFNDNCPSKFLVRLVNPRIGRLINDVLESEKNMEGQGDIRGYGRTIQEAVNKALREKEKAYNQFRRRMNSRRKEGVKKRVRRKITKNRS